MCRVRVPCQHAGRQPVGRRSAWSLRTLVPAGRPRGPCCYLSPASADDAKLIYVSPRAGPAARIRFPPLVKTRTETEWRVRARGSLTRERGGRVGFWGWCEGSGRGHGFSGAGPRRPAEQSGGTAPTGARGRLRPPLPTASRGRQHGPRTGRLPILPPFARGRFASWGGGRGRASRRHHGNVSHGRAARTSRDSKAFPPLGVRLANRVTRIPLPLTRFEKELTGGRTLRWDGKKHTRERA